MTERTPDIIFGMREIAKVLRRSEVTVYAWLRSDNPDRPPIYKRFGTYYASKAELEKWMLTNQEKES